MVSAPTAGRRRRVVILVENLPVPFDRRVWQESQTLRDAGYDVTVICPAAEGFPAGRYSIEGIAVRRFALPVEAARTTGYIAEYLLALLAMLRHLCAVAFRGRVDVIHACNPPDLLFMLAVPFKVLCRTRFVFDHHDVSPELLLAKGHSRRSLVVRLALVLERLTFRYADVSIATNDSYRRLAVERGRMDPSRVFVVRSGVNLERVRMVGGNASLKRGREHLVAYVGVMGRQEGIDYLLDAAYAIVHGMGRRDVQFTLAGSGPEIERLKARSRELGLNGYVEFLGRVSDDVLFQLLETADVCVNPDEHNLMNDMSTMNKILEYMAFGKPIVQFDLTEGRISAGEASLYSSPNDAVAMAKDIVELIDDPHARERMGAIGRERLVSSLTWDHQKAALLNAYEMATCGPKSATRPIAS